MCCQVVNVWRINSEEVYIPCSEKGDTLCHYDQKIADGLCEPAPSNWNDPKSQVLLRKEVGGVAIWTR